MDSLNIWTITLISVISLARIGMGVFTSISGPTLLYLADNVGASVSKISTLFSGRSIGILFGSILGGVVKNLVGPNFRHLLMLGAGIGILGLVDLAVPWISQFWVLIIDITLGGIMFGYLDAGLQALILQLWGEKASRAQIQLFHFMYSVGAFIAPLMASPFLAMADEETSADASCPNQISMTTTAAYPHSNLSTTAITPAAFNPVGWAYVIAACWMVFVSILLVVLAILNVESRVASSIEDKGFASEDRGEEPIKDVIWLFLLVVGYYFCSVSTENVFFSYIYSVSLCSDLNFTVEQASQINSVFWLGLGLGRLSGVLAANFLKPRTIIIASIIGSIIDMIFMCIFGEHTAWLAWLVSALHGYTTAMLYPSGVSWVSQITNISGTYMFVCNIGNAVGSLTMLPLGGYLFDIDPFSVMYLVLILAVVNAFFYAALLYVGKRHKEFLRNKQIDVSTERPEKDSDYMEDCKTENSSISHDDR
ncbi:sodium-dependent glucose transporter 1A-like isoform X2 [Styela clava]|uniref:sodium-dependent glucose transporter 1A-like isoform X2 n=1 Tax=Styela clava TaxID=7725 RepID=UPI00193A9B97|nr:sodium-dependent glucose transporter 1A-like isoform X2 [Styela clava]